MSRPYSWPSSALRALNPRALEDLPGHRSVRLRLAVYQLLILPRYTLPQTFRAFGGTGTSAMSRGTWNIATSPVEGSTETTISVSVLNDDSPGRWSEPTSRTFRRSLPSQGGRVGRGVPVASVPSGVGSTSGLSVGSSLAWARPESLGSAESPGAGVSSAVWQSGLVSSSLNTHWTRLSAIVL